MTQQTKVGLEALTFAALAELPAFEPLWMAMRDAIADYDGTPNERAFLARCRFARSFARALAPNAGWS